jgi:GNAT superfamily N-acetyltransferase
MPAPPKDTAEHPYLLIEYEWHTDLEPGLREQVAAFAADAADYDAEAGFTRITEFGRPTSPARAGDRPTRLLVYAAGKADTGGKATLAAYLSIEHVDEDGTADAIFVVAPEYRSRGIATLLAETLQANAETGDWFGTGVRRLVLTAAGPHPASERLANRFGIAVDHQRWVLVKRLREPIGHPELPGGDRITSASRHEPADLDPATVGEASYAAALDAIAPGDVPADRPPMIWRRSYQLSDAGGQPETEMITRVNVRPDRPSSLGFVEFTRAGGSPDDGELDALIDAALSDLWTDGVRAVFAFADPEDIDVVKALRRSFFVHDQTNLTYVVDVESAGGRQAPES